MREKVTKALCMLMVGIFVSLDAYHEVLCYNDHMEIKAILVKAFTADKNAGNPAGVILNADNLTDTQMQSIATDLGFSESVFVMKSEVADYKMRYFSLTQEVDYCAHATLAACHVLQDIESYETNAGVLKVDVDQDDGRIYLPLKKPIFGSVINNEILSIILGIGLEEFDENLPSQVVSVGVPKLIVPIKSLNTLLAIEPDYEGIKKLCNSIGARGLYLFTSETILEDSNYHARQFNPLCGIDEDPITGIAVGALAAYLSVYDNNDRKRRLEGVVEQGYCMGKFGLVNFFINPPKGSVLVGGQAVVFSEKIFNAI